MLQYLKESSSNKHTQNMSSILYPEYIEWVYQITFGFSLYAVSLLIILVAYFEGYT